MGVACVWTNMDQYSLGVSGQVWLQVQGQKDDSSAGFFEALGF